MRTISYVTYLNRYRKSPLIDVRSPLEYCKGHISSAVNIPLFSNRQRALIGTLYKQKGRNAAIEEALSLVNLSRIAKRAKGFSSPVVVYCARGGMRSQAVGWLLELLGYKVLLLKQGYKHYRRWVLEQIQKPYNLFLLTGKTGVGKTHFLKKITQHLNLEGLACHKGSTFGALKKAQPSQEAFENALAETLFFLRKGVIFLEDESRNIGQIIIPEPFFSEMQRAPGIILEDHLDKRVNRIISEYQKMPFEKLKDALLRLQKRLGLENTKKALNYLENRDYENCVKLLLVYYDKKYAFTIEKRKTAFPTLDLSQKKEKEILTFIQEFAGKNY